MYSSGFKAGFAVIPKHTARKAKLYVIRLCTQQRARKAKYRGERNPLPRENLCTERNVSIIVSISYSIEALPIEFDLINFD